VTAVSALLIFVALILFVLAQLFLKHAMESDLRSARFTKNFAIGLSTMTASFFITLGLLQHFELSYLYPFQGLSVVIISLLAAAILREKLTSRLFFGAALISAGVVLVSLS
jgi:drug/metabolite transporter (DMT)-like permease